MSLFDLTGRFAIVTGANTGIGQAIAVGLAQAGADIVGVGRSAMTQTQESVVAKGRRFFPITADLSQANKAADVIGEALALGAKPDILVNNAGIIRRGDALDFTEEDWDAVLDTNLKSAFFLSQAFAKAAVAAGKPAKIINIASMLSFQGGIRVASYTAAKSGLAGLTKLMANEWAAKGINVNAIAPGYVETNNTTALRADAERNADILKRIPAGRWARADDMAGAAVFLASSASDYVHGAILPVDGGWLAR
ncbi:2-dehydro-3-deoxy-D-gluconate 5-dehydrogenase KduD [Pararhizobium arenae]|uniref:2-dehydro-3-deoxy-D-gluconate 5-dehydrogenase KduD n=1 Tax=Pararhizobium arenae TaxID=1856850 RepID=UPI00094AB28B|nr:2-dehydro-3-deoxy-D-gluconate 5-dehydrogenase KduD [Pararhizobium arenae]